MSMMIIEEEKSAAAPPPYVSRISEAIVRLHRRGAATHLTQLLSKLKPAELGQVLNSFPEHKATDLFAHISPPQHAAAVLEEMNDDHKRYILAHSDEDFAIAVLKRLPPEVRNRRIMALSDQTAERLAIALQDHPIEEEKFDELYEEDTAGSIMSTEFFAMPESTTSAEAIEAVQGLSSHESVFYLYVVDDLQRLTGVCSLRRLILAEPHKTLKEFTSSRLIKVHASTPQGAVAQQISRYRLLAMPVVDDLGVLVGQITIDNLIHVIQEENTSSLLKMAGIGSKKTNVLSQSAAHIFRTRVPWLITAFVAYLIVSAILDGFEATLEKVVQLAFFFPIVIGMSGNAGSQTGTVVVRGLALGIIHDSHFFKLLGKEVGANLIQGSIYGAILSLASYLIFQNPMLSLTLGPAMALSITCASAIAMSLPFFFKRLGVDPAIAAGPLALAFIDLIGSLNYLTIAYIVFET